MTVYVGFSNPAQNSFADDQIVRGGDSYEYGLKLDSDVFFVGGAATKTYMLLLGGERPSGSAATGDSNDALLRGSWNNYAANDANFIMRGINVSINNRSGGTLGIMENQLGCQNKSGGTTPTIRGLTVVPENYGTCATEFGGVDIVLKNEGAAATTQYGLRIRNIDNSTANAVTSAISITDTGTNTGFTYGLDFNGSSIVTADIRMASGAVLSSGSGAPSHSATQGSLYLRTGQTVNAIIYLNTDGGTTWTLLNAVQA